MKYYWKHHKSGDWESWSLNISQAQKNINIGWLEKISDNEWRFEIPCGANMANTTYFLSLSKREVRERCVAIMKAFYEMENGNKERKE